MDDPARLLSRSKFPREFKAPPSHGSGQVMFKNTAASHHTSTLNFHIPLISMDLENGIEDVRMDTQAETRLLSAILNMKPGKSKRAKCQECNLRKESFHPGVNFPFADHILGTARFDFPVFNCVLAHHLTR